MTKHKPRCSACGSAYSGQIACEKCGTSHAGWRTVGDYIACVEESTDFARTTASRWLAWARTLPTDKPFPVVGSFRAWERANYERSQLTRRTWADVDAAVRS